PDQSQLHLTPGQVMPPRAELAQYVLMKVVAELGQGTKRTALGMDLTGCYTTLWQSKEGAKALARSSSGKDSAIVNLLKRLTGEGVSPNAQDAHHPKMQTVVEEVLKRWERGEKSLVFCFRIPTARTLNRLLKDGVSQRQSEAKRALFATRSRRKSVDPDKIMQQFRRALTSREGSGVPLFVDRVLYGWLFIHDLEIPYLTESDIRRVAELCSRAQHANVPVFRDLVRPDRVFLHRAIEHCLAIRLSRDLSNLGPFPEHLRTQTEALLKIMSNEDWVKYRYGDSSLTSAAPVSQSESGQRAENLAKTSIGARYELQEEKETAIESAVANSLMAQLRKGHNTLLESLTSGPNLFAPLGNCVTTIGEIARDRAKDLSRLEFMATLPQQGVVGYKIPKITVKELLGEGRYIDERSLDHVIRFSTGKFYLEWNWLERAKIHDAVVRAFLREDILFRMPASIFQGNEETWRESLLRGFHETNPESPQMEPLSHRIAEFIRDLIEMGPDEREAHLRYAMNPQAESVALVTGEDKVDRDAIFSGFNTPLLPDILVCTAVGQEGIDLHRQCSHVIHYDLGWNPATIEQRTGRTDRIGSKALRERKLAERSNVTGNAMPEQSLPGLEIALPYLAGTYDERMFDCLRMRAQVFDILTGGDPTLDTGLDSVWLNADDYGEQNNVEFIALPPKMLADLRVDLSVSKN
ncbi:MAG: helicase-related protein, partial [Nitrospira sp.]